MNQGIYALSATMVNQLNRVDLLSNNIANVNTTAFKQDNLVEGSFNYYLKQLSEKEQTISDVSDPQLIRLNNVTNTIPKIDGEYMKEDIGALIQTGNKLDFALNQTDMFFKVQDKNGNLLLTKSGNFKNLNGLLVTEDGYKVLDKQNKPIVINNQFEEKIALVKSDFSNLQKQGNNNYLIKNEKDTQIVPSNHGYILQGTLEKSNVNMINSMVALIDSQRRIEQAQKAISGIDQINGKLITQIGNR